ncbi:acyltransferase family protein [Guptibacillus hwajinpoensis]|uniref:acyltransferase family protein n=1 Tax=Guptibacillus hwajinpoensis TaxID=208199 RepID=UPI0024B3BF8F|nr:acyltransferase [Pseudalkalibacillus hwajinpoensis]
MRANKNKLSLVQVSRAIAILFVLIGHANGLFYKQFDYDWFNIAQWDRTGGVDFFFVVSGFMIYYIYHKNRGNPFKAREFLFKRVIRIFPLYWLMLLATVGLFLLVPTLNSGPPLTSLTIIKNVFLFTTDPILAVTWSLSFILFFYLIFAAYLYQPKIIKYVVPIWIAMILFTQYFTKHESFFLSFNHLEIYSGCFVAYLVLHFNIRFEKVLVIAGILGFLFLWVMNVNKVLGHEFLFTYSVFSLLIILGIATMDLKKNREIPSKLSLLGDASYSIYICHGPVIQLFLLLFAKFRIYEETGFFVYLTLIISLTTVSCFGIYLFIEKPMTTFLRKRLLKNSILLQSSKSSSVERIS